MGKTVYLSNSLWHDLSTYLYIDRKLADGKKNRQGDYSRFKVLTTYFGKHAFNRDSFNSFIQEKKDKGYSNSYINNLIKLAKHLDKFLKTNQLSDYTYFKRNDNHFVDIFSPQEIKKIAEYSYPYKLRHGKDSSEVNEKYYCIYMLLGLTGMRIGELINLKWNDFYTDYCILRDTKNGSDRVVPIPRFLGDRMAKLPHSSDTLFNSHHDTTINHDLKKRCEALGIVKKQISVHIFRHSFITTMLSSTGETSIMQIAQIVGHHDLNSTQIYTHLQIESLKNTQSMHPICRSEETLSSLTERLKKVIEKLVDIERFDYTINSSKKMVNLTLSLK